MAAATAKISGSVAAKGAAAESTGIVLEQAANEFVFAVVGHVGSGYERNSNGAQGASFGSERKNEDSAHARRSGVDHFSA